MTTVTRRIEEMSSFAPEHISTQLFREHTYTDGYTLHPKEKLHAAAIGTSVDNLTRTLTLPTSHTATPTAYRQACMDIFTHSLSGLRVIDLSGKLQHNDPEEYWLELIDTLSPKPTPEHVEAVVRLSIAEMAFRSSRPTNVHIDIATPDIENIMIMAKRSVTMLDDLGGPLVSGFHFDEGGQAVLDDSLIKQARYYGGYTSTVTSGDGDFLTNTHLLDMKVSTRPASKRHLLQVLTYWRMGLHSFDRGEKPLYGGAFYNVTHLGIINPRLFTSYTVDCNQFTREDKDFIDNEVIEYKATPQFKKHHLNTHATA